MLISLVRGLLTSIRQVAGRLVFDGTGLDDETFYSREMFQSHGLASIPPEGSETLVLRAGNVIVAIAAQKPTIVPDLDGEGAAALYRDASRFVRVNADGSIDITTDGALSIDCGSMTVNTDGLTVDA